MTPDDYILAKVAKFSHWLQRLTGMTSYRQAFHAASAATLVQLLTVIDYWFPWMFAGGDNVFSLVIVTPSVLFWAWLASVADGCDKEFMANPKALPRFAGATAFLRMFILGTGAGGCIVIIGLYAIGTAGKLEYLGFLGAASVSAFPYLLSTPPLPPGESKVRQWINSLQTALRPAEATR